MHIDLEYLGEKGCPEDFTFPKTGEHAVVRIPYHMDFHHLSDCADEYMEIAYCIEVLSAGADIVHSNANEQNSSDCYVDVTIKVRDRKKEMGHIQYLAGIRSGSDEYFEQQLTDQEFSDFVQKVMENKEDTSIFAASDMVKSFWSNHDAQEPDDDDNFIDDEYEEVDDDDA